jgi:hypothetical protein
VFRRTFRDHACVSMRAACLVAIAAGALADERGGPRNGNPKMTTTSAPHQRTNRLARATSPYLLQHAHNPVDWYEWGPEALERANKEKKPIFLSIGYSACHWCHVMERESFENEEIAAVMNKHFVCIKVDREERPDLDDIYMTATQAMTRSGGWPMSVWLTPDQKPFYAGTYFPPDDRFGRPGFKRVLEFLAETWEKDRDKALQQADSLTQAVQILTAVEPGDSVPAQEVVEKATEALVRNFDPIKGGISGGGTNRFPPCMALDLMLRMYHQSVQEAGSGKTPNKKLLEMVELTLDKMAHGGIYDQLGGGIARYSTDVDWLVPHFEKMLYDQALVSDIYLKAYQLTKKPLYARIAREIFDYVIADLQSPEGGFYCTRDADSEGVEGKFYVWSRAEVSQVLGDDEAALFCDYYDVTDAGNWEGHNILNVPRPLETVAKLHKMAPGDLESRLSASRKKLFTARERRVKPHLDDKILASWNGLMIASMAKGARILGDEKYQLAAARAADFVLDQMTQPGGAGFQPAESGVTASQNKGRRLLRTYRQGRAHTPAYLDDHANMIEALLNLYEATFDLKWLDRAVALNEIVLRHFGDDKEGGFFYIADDGERVLVRSKDAGDSATPSGNSVQLMNLLRLSVLLDRKDFADQARRLLRAFAGKLAESPFSSERMLSGLDFCHRPPREVAFVGGSADLSKLDELVNVAWRNYTPNVVFARLVVDAPEARELQKRIPLLAAKAPKGGEPCAYVCKNFACRAPVDTPAKLLDELNK